MLCDKDKRSYIEAVEKNLPLLEDFEAVYLFGSVLDAGKKPHDIDMLVLYEGSPESKLASMEKAMRGFEEEIDMPIDLTALSVEEEMDVGFLKKLNGRYLQLK